MNKLLIVLVFISIITRSHFVGASDDLNLKSSNLLDSMTYHKSLLKKLNYKDPFNLKYQLSKIRFLDLDDFQNYNKEIKWFFDPDDTLKNFYRINTDSLNHLNSLSFYSDYNHKKQKVSSHEFKRRLKHEAVNKKFKIAIDPGHFGEEWFSNQTKKYVTEIIELEDGSKKEIKIKEAVINLIVARLLKKKFKSIGVDVLLTKNDLGRVSKESFDHFNYKEISKQLFFNSLNDDWFNRVLKESIDNDNTFNSFLNHERIQKLINPQRSFKQFLAYDLYERARIINEYNPDIALIVHFDTTLPRGVPRHTINPNNYNKTKIFIPGNFKLSSFAGNFNKHHIFSHLLKSHKIGESYKLSKYVVESMSKQLGLELDDRKGWFWDSIKVEDGIYARNLSLTRLLPGIAISYLECFYYNSRDEFYNLLEKDYTMDISGKKYFYSHRLEQVAESVFLGVKDYIQEQKNNANQ